MINYVQQISSKLFIVACAAFSLYSCQDDFLEMGSDLVDDVSYTNDSLTLPVTAYNTSFFNTGVQTNNYAAGALGVYDDPIYGQSIASTVSQLSLVQTNPSIGDSAVVDKVVVTLPYYSTAIAQTAEGGTEYRLDSVFGNSPMNITAYRSNYYLSDNNPQNVSENAVYYSNQLDQFNGLKSDMLFTVSDFTPSNAEIVESVPPASTSTDTTNTIERSAPAFQLTLTNEDQLNYWRNAILDRAGDDVLYNQNSFKNYFRGIYLEAQPINGNGSYFLFDRSASRIEIYYTSGSSDARIQSSLTLSLSPTGQAVIGYDNDFEPGITSMIQQADSINGDENLYLKGGQGSMAIIDLFGADSNGDGIPERLEELRQGNTEIIREANLIFYVDREKLNQLSDSDFVEPERVFLYDLENNQPLDDYFLDVARDGNGNIIGAGTTHLEPLTRNANDEGQYYKIRITEHVKNLLDPGNENPSTKLGLVVAENLLPSAVNTGAIENASPGEKPNRLPVTSILSQKGTILHGSQSADPAKNVSLQLYFLETPNQ